MRPVCHCLWLLAILHLVACPDREKVSPKGHPPDAETSRSLAVDASVLPARPLAAAVVLEQGCRCGELAAKTPDAVAAARAAMVEAMDSLNAALRHFLESLDGALGPGDAQLKELSPHREALSALRCQLRCLLSQLSGFTRPAWAYLEQSARFLDVSAAALSRLSLPAGKRAPGPGGAELTAEFNSLARLSNLCVGLELIAPVKPEPSQALDSVAFRVKTRRWVKATAAILDAQRQALRGAEPQAGAGMPGSKARSQAGEIQESMALTVAHARLRQILSTQLREAQALRCERGEACAALSAAFAKPVSAVKDMIQATLEADIALSSAGDRPLAPGHRAALSKSMEAAIKAWAKAAEGLGPSQ